VRGGGLYARLAREQEALEEIAEGLEAAEVPA